MRRFWCAEREHLPSSASMTRKAGWYIMSTPAPSGERLLPQVLVLELLFTFLVAGRTEVKFQASTVKFSQPRWLSRQRVLLYPRRVFLSAKLFLRQVSSHAHLVIFKSCYPFPFLKTKNRLEFTCNVREPWPSVAFYAMRNPRA